MNTLLPRLPFSLIHMKIISPDDIDSRKAFAEKHALNFPLLTDPEHLLLEKLGIWVEKE